MLSYRLGTLNDFHWGVEPVLSYSKPHTFSTSSGEERKNIYSLQPGHLEAEQNDMKVKRCKIKKKVSKRKYKRLLCVKIITGPWQNGQG